MNEDVHRAAELLRQGGLVGLPTETVYGLGADAGNELAVRRIFAVKGRPSSHPLIVHVADAAGARRWAAHFPPAATVLAKVFWPGPLTLILPRAEHVLDAVTGGQPTVALRVPNHPLALELLRAFDGGIAAPSANRFGAVSPTTAAHVRRDLGAEVDFVLDGGACAIGLESTIVDLSAATPGILRVGGLPREDIEYALGQPIPLRVTSEVRAPGTLASHYAPRAGVVLTTSTEMTGAVAGQRARGRRVAVLAAVPPSDASAGYFAMPPDPRAFAQQLYATLREADEAGFDVIIVEAPGQTGIGAAVHDRLVRAAAPRPDQTTR